MRRPFKTFRRFTTASMAALVAGALIVCFAMLLSGIPEIHAESPIAAVAVQKMSVKGDRLLVLTKGTGCSSLGWPRYEQSCQFDMRRRADDKSVVRVIALR